jgi:hypothetical protein
MDPVSHLSRIVELLRRQAPAAAGKLGQKGKSAATGDSQAAADRPSVEQLERQISKRIRGLDSGKTEHKRRATRIFVESVLAWEFGDRVMSDPRFFALVDYVQTAMESDPSTDAEIRSMLDSMHA